MESNVYTTYYAIKGEPFLNKPSPGLYYDSAIHHKAWDFLLAGLHSAEPHLMLTGEYGAGKTLLSLKLVEHLKNQGDQVFVYISTPMQSYLDVLRRIYTALELGPIDETCDEETLHFRIYRHFETHQHRSLIVILDDVQEYDARQLNQIRLLANYSQDGFFPIRLFLFANTAFRERLKSADLEPLNQRIKRRHHLTHLAFEEVKEYIYFHLIKAGAKGTPFFPDSSIQRIMDLSEGFPRRINNICDMCLLIGGSRGLDIIESPTVLEAAQNLGLHTETELEELSAQSQPLQHVRIEASSSDHDTQRQYGERPAPKHPPQSGTYLPIDNSANYAAEQDSPTTMVAAEEREPEYRRGQDQGLGEAPSSHPEVDYYTWAWRLGVIVLIIAILAVVIPL